MQRLSLIISFINKFRMYLPCSFINKKEVSKTYEKGTSAPFLSTTSGVFCIGGMKDDGI
jgi:hypothetical protein